MNIIVCKSHYEVHLAANHTLNRISLRVLMQQQFK